MNIIDILLILVVALAIWGGWQKGFILGFLDLAALAVSMLATFFLYPYVALFIEKYIAPHGIWILPVSFMATYITLRIIAGSLVNLVVRDIRPDAHGHGINKFLGVVPGFVNGLIYATILAALLLALPLSDNVSENTRESRIASRLSMPVEWLESKLSPVFDEAIKRTMNKMTVEPDSKEFVTLPFKESSPKVREDLETQMVRLINQERIKEGLQPVKADPELVPVARSHSRDMFARGYFAHNTPEGRDPFDRMRESNIKFTNAGENLALAQTLEIAHNGLMNSPGHRANILRPQFGRVGIGILDGGMYGLMISQEFRN
jgi:uncharacterized protein YkwD